MSDLVLIFEGSDSQSQILKHHLEQVDINVLIKSDSRSGAIAGFGSFGSYRVYVLKDDQEKAAEIVKTFKSQQPE